MRLLSAGAGLRVFANDTPVGSSNQRVSKVRAGVGATLLGALAIGVAPQPAFAQAPARVDTAPGVLRELLNSERIERRFGSYGVEVLASDANWRVSNLYSIDSQTGTTCRTFAVVRYPETIHPRLAAEHAEILRGGSIGAVLTARGWRVLKAHLGYDEIEASDRLAALMRVPRGTRLARHVYVLDVETRGEVLAYAALVEIHHPDHLRVGDLRDIYGAASAAGREALLARLLEAAAAEVARQPTAVRAVP